MDCRVQKVVNEEDYVDILHKLKSRNIKKYISYSKIQFIQFYVHIV